MLRVPSSGWGDLISSRLSQQKLCNFPFCALSSTPHACQAGKFYVSEPLWRELKRPGRARYRFSPRLGVMQKCECFHRSMKSLALLMRHPRRGVPGNSLCKRSREFKEVNSQIEFYVFKSPSAFGRKRFMVKRVWIDFLFTSGEGNARELQINENICLSDKSFESFQNLIFSYLWATLRTVQNEAACSSPRFIMFSQGVVANLHFKTFFHVFRLLTRPKLFLMKNEQKQSNETPQPSGLIFSLLLFIQAPDTQALVLFLTQARLVLLIQAPSSQTLLFWLQSTFVPLQTKEQLFRLTWSDIKPEQKFFSCLLYLRFRKVPSVLLWIHPHSLSARLTEPLSEVFHFIFD